VIGKARALLQREGGGAVVDELGLHLVTEAPRLDMQPQLFELLRLLAAADTGARLREGDRPVRR